MKTKVGRMQTVLWLSIGCLGLLPLLPLTAQEPKLRDTLQGHSSTVTSVAFSADGKTLASASHDGTLRLWDVTTGKERTTLGKYAGCVGCVAISPDGKTMASGIIGSPVPHPDLKNVKLWEVTTGTVRAKLKGHIGYVHSVAFSPDGKSLASGSSDGTVKLWELVTGQERATFQGHTSHVVSVAFSPDGKMLASGSDDKTAKLWDVATGRERALLQGHTEVVMSVSFSPDGKMLASGSGDKTVKLWEVATGKARITFNGHTEVVHSVAFSPDSPRDSCKPDIDEVAYALERLQTFLSWIEEHRGSFEKERDTDPESAAAELRHLQDSTEQAVLHLQRLTELLLAGYTIDPAKTLPRGFCSATWLRKVQILLRERGF